MLSTILILLLAAGYLLYVMYSLFNQITHHMSSIKVNILMVVCAIILIVACVMSLKTGRSITRLITPDDVFEKYQNQ